MSRRWERVYYTTPSVWRRFEVHSPVEVRRSSPVLAWSAVPQQLRQQQRQQREQEWLQAVLQQLRRVAPLVHELVVPAAYGKMTAIEVLPGLLLALAEAPVATIDACGFQQVVSLAAMRALAGLTQLCEVGLGRTDYVLPANCGWALGQLPQLTSLWLKAWQFGAPLLEAVAGLSGLADLQLDSSKPLPGEVQGLTALRQLQLLSISELRSEGGLAVLPASAFPERSEAAFASPALKVRFI